MQQRQLFDGQQAEVESDQRACCSCPEQHTTVQLTSFQTQELFPLLMLAGLGIVCYLDSSELPRSLVD